MKTCIECKQEKENDCFSKKKGNKDGLNGLCKECNNTQVRKWRSENKEKIAEYNTQYQQDNKKDIAEFKKQYNSDHAEEISAYSKQYRFDHKDEISEYNTQYYYDHLDYFAEHIKEYRENNKDAIRKQNNDYIKTRRKNDPIFNMRRSVSEMINNVLRRSGGSKEGNSCIDNIPYTIKELNAHLEGLFSHPNNLTPDGKVWMTWENRGVYDPKTWNDNDPTTWKWQLDHKKPQSTLPFTSMDDDNFQICWSLDNLRPLKAKDNVLDGVNRTRHDIND